MTLVASAASLLAAMPLSTVLAQWTWLVDSFLIVAVLCGLAVVVRSLRAPTWAPTAAMVLAGLMVLTWLYPSGREIGGIIPSVDTFKHFNTLLTTAAFDMRGSSAPVERSGVLFLTTLGVGSVAIVIDLLAVVQRRPALAGLPMLAIYSVPVAVAKDSVSPFPFLLGAAGYLWLLVADNLDRVRRFGRRFTGDSRHVDQRKLRPLAAVGGRLGFVGLVLAVLLPLAWPGMSIGWLERFGNGAGFTSGSANGHSVSLTAALSGELTRKDADPMIRVTNLDDDTPFYLRFAVADQLGNDGFVNRLLSGGSRINRGIPSADFVHSGIKTSIHRATVEVLDLDQAFLPVYTAPSTVEGLDDTWLYDQATATIYANRETTRKRRYSFTYVKPEFTAADLRSADPLDPSSPIVADYATVPSAFGLVKDIVDREINGKTTEYDKVMALLDFFATSNGFVYSLSTGSGTSGSKIVDFLTNQRGFCVQYSAALGWLLRQAKIPSRVAFGFTQGGVKQGNTVTLTSSSLHAWTEAYFPGFGWVPFDATPATGVGGSVSPAWAPNPSRPQTTEPNTDTNVQASGQAPATDAGGAASNAQGPRADPTGGSAATKHGIKFVVSVVGIGLAALVVLLLMSPAISRRRRRRRRLKFRQASEAAFARVSGGPGGGARNAAYQAARADAHEAWDELLDTMTDFHVEIDDAETPRKTGVRLLERERLRGDAATAVQVLSTAEEYARYARHPVTGQELRSSIGAVRSALSARATWRTRIMAVLLPPSVVQPWRRAMPSRQRVRRRDHSG